MPGPFDTGPVVEQLLNATVQSTSPDTILCSVSGEIDLATAPSLQRELDDLIDRAPRHLVIDLTDVQFMGSIGLHILMHLHEAQLAAGHDLAVVVDHNDAATRLLHATGLDHVLNLHTELTTAMHMQHTIEPESSRPQR
jgi:anti-anti-sigma factor